MDYDLSRLGDRQFEHLAQALAIHHLGPEVGTFGSGPDGGREATWHGRLSNPFLQSESWQGYGVIQAKYKLRASTPKENANWLLTAINKELADWADASNKRNPVPDIYLIITNIVLSPAADGGIDTVLKKFEERSKELGLAIGKFVIWHYDQIRVLLDDAASIRASYAAWITPGDVLASLIASSLSNVADIKNTLYSYAAKTMLDEVTLNLTQAGTVGDKPIGIADVFVDLPAKPTSQIDRQGRDEIVEGIASELIRVADRKLDPDSQKNDSGGNRGNRVVLVGGPGQGKSTVGQFLCQVYRSNFLAGTDIAKIPDIVDTVTKLNAHCERIGIITPGARRWPFSIKLTSLADALAKHRQRSLLEYIAAEISERSGAPISVVNLKHWLADYPWLVLLDGFDEVPASSNRDQVLKIIRDFLVDAASVSADVIVIATTRPQGYNDDFDPRRYRHYNLTDLKVNDALKYARRLLEIRLGLDTPRLRTVYSRLERTAHEEATARLLSTPLQTTILCLLVERLGQAPKDRWRLFSQYYKVIYQREQEKGGPLAEILHDYENHIHAIHRETGFMLQERGEHAGDTTSFLTAKGLIDIIAQRLMSKGYTESEADRLARQFREIFTDRLVFLTELRHDVYGFEIRSLQEFMAGEAVVQQMESKTSSNFRKIAASSYWRNTVLFAVGKIFAERDHLCGEVVSLCIDLNLDGKLNRLVKPGSELALSILSEGVARTHPAYGRPLAACACQSLNSATPAVRLLHELDAAGMKEHLDSAVSEALNGTTSKQVSAMIVLASRVSADETPKLAALRAAIEEASDNVIRNLIKVAWFSGDSVILALVGEKILSYSPLLLARDAEDDVEEVGSLDVIDTEIPAVTILPIPNWLISLRRIMGYGPSDYSPRSIRLNVYRSIEVNTQITSLSRENNEWLDLAGIPHVDGPWEAVKAVAEFTISPSAESLAAALRHCATHFRQMGWLLSRAGWPLMCCFEDAMWHDIDQFTNADGIAGEYEYFENRLLQLSEAAAAGELGDKDDWLAAEARWRGVIQLDELLQLGPRSKHSGFDGNLPVWPGLRELGMPVTNSWYGLHNSSNSILTLEEAFTSVSKMISIYRVYPAGAQKSHLARMMIFVGDVISRYVRETDSQGKNVQAFANPKNSYFTGLLASLNPDDALAVIADAASLGWFHSLSAEAASTPEIYSYLVRLGRCRRLPYITYRETLLAKLIRKEDDVIPWEIARIVLHGIRTRAIFELSLSTDSPDQTQMVSRLQQLQKLIRAAPQDDAGAKKLVLELLEPIRVGDDLGWLPYDSVNLRMAALYLERSSRSSALARAVFAEAALDECPEIGMKMVKSLAQIVANTKAFPDTSKQEP